MSVIISIVSIAASVWIFFGYIDSSYQSIKSLKEEKSSYESALSSANEAEKIKSELTAKYNSIDPATLERLNTLLPDSVDAVRLIIEINNLAGRSGMVVKETKISELEKNEGSLSNAGLKPNQYGTITIDFSVSGPYDNLLSFLSSLERDLRIVDVSNFSLKPIEGSSYQYDFKVKTYWLK